MIKRNPGFSGKMFWSLDIPFKTGFTVYIYQHVQISEIKSIVMDSRTCFDNYTAIFREI